MNADFLTKEHILTISKQTITVFLTPLVILVRSPATIYKQKKQKICII